MLEQTASHVPTEILGRVMLDGMRAVMVALLLTLGACGSQGVERAHRWPKHRKEGDRRFAELERLTAELTTRNEALEQKNAELEARLKLIEQWIANSTRKSAESQPAPPAPSTGR
jgi:hypothetical protein